MRPRVIGGVTAVVDGAERVSVSGECRELFIKDSNNVEVIGKSVIVTLNFGLIL